MPSKIKILDEQTINKIAAGEVIENPSSVVKELVENATDAGATEITVEIKGGGRQLIRISDNGSGMNSDDALLCLERHATSKILEVEDIHKISTMGFRGEAVPSIAAISKFSLLTRCEEAEKGTLILVEGGKISLCSGAPRSRGTTFEVKSLFFNVPVRKKFQKSPTYDANEILKVITIQSLAHPHIKFQLISNEKNLLTTKLSQKELEIDQIGERISEVLGQQYFSGLSPVEKEEAGYRLTGFIGAPGFTRQNRTGQYLFINKRPVFSLAISQTIKEAYGTSLMPQRHPVFVFFLSMEGSLVDVNVHPQKRQIRLRQEFQIKDLLTKAVQKALNYEEKKSFSLSYSYQDTPFSPAPFPLFPGEKEAGFSKSFYEQEPFTEIRLSEMPLRIHEKPKASSLDFFDEKKEETFSDAGTKVIAVMPGFLLLLSFDDKIWLLDQRAAHARILFEQLLRQDQKEALPIQDLLIPITFELTSDMALLLEENMPFFNQFGFQIQAFGGKSFIVNSVPQFLEKVSIEHLLKDILSDLSEFKDAIKTELQKNLAQAAGKRALSRKKKISILEGQTLFQLLMQCESPFQCPSGKPTIVELKQEEVAKQFQR